MLIILNGTGALIGRVMSRLNLIVLLLIAAIVLSLNPVAAQNASRSSNINIFTWRNISPGQFGTRIHDLAVPRLIEHGFNHTGRIIYAASPGGLYKTQDWGVTWRSMTDSLPDSAVSAVSVSPTDPNAIWIGTGDYLLAYGRDVAGSGVYKSSDGGAHWLQAGLPDSLLIGRIRIDPKDPNTVFIAVLGSRWKASPDRGVYRTHDGGKTWQRVAYVGPLAGAVDLAIDPVDSNILYAAMWQFGENHGADITYGPESQVLRSTDGGDSWTRLSGGLPEGNLGRIAITISPVNPRRLYALVDDHDLTINANIDGSHPVKQPGVNVVYTSTDTGDHWVERHRTDDYSAEYYGRILADSADENMLYQVNGSLAVSSDAGHTFRDTIAGSKDQYICVLDDHDIWIDPDDASHLICAGDVGISESADRGQTWRTFENIPGGLYYTLVTDYVRPFYHIFGTLQDIGVLGVVERTRTRAIRPPDWVATQGTEGTGLSSDPFHPDAIYGFVLTGGGDAIDLIGRYDQQTGEEVDISPDSTLGRRENERIHNAPVLASQLRPNTIYTGVDRLHRSADGGRTWTALTADVTLPLPSHVSAMGETRRRHILEKDAIRSIAESPLSPNVVWAGTQFGLLYATHDGGRTWEQVHYPSTLAPETAVIAQITPSRQSLGTAYVAINATYDGDFAPYILKTTDFGQHWSNVVTGLPRRAAVWSVAEDPQNDDLLFAGTDKAVFYSLNSGRTWQSLRLNMPSIRVTAVVVQRQQNDLVVGTWGRGIYVIDDITPLEYQLSSFAHSSLLFPIHDTLRFHGPSASWIESDNLQDYRSPNPTYGARIGYFVPRSLARLGGRIDIEDLAGTSVAGFAVDTRAGLHRVMWGMDARRRIATGRFMSIPLPPGQYRARLKIGSTVSPWRSLRIEGDPIIGLSAAGYHDQYDALVRVADLEARAYNVLAAAKKLKRSIGMSRPELRRRLDGLLQTFTPPAAGFDALDALFTPPGVIQHLDDLAVAITLSTTAPTQTQLHEIDKASQIVRSLQLEEAQIRTGIGHLARDPGR